MNSYTDKHTFFVFLKDNKESEYKEDRGDRQVLQYQKIPRASNYVLEFIVIIILNKSNEVVSRGMRNSGFYSWIYL